MADLAKKKRLRAGHRGSTTRMLTQVNKLLKADKVDLVKLAQLKLSLQEKLDTLKQFDSEVLELTDDDGVEAEIQSADEYKDGIYSAMVGIDELSMKLKTPSAAGTPPPADTVHAAVPAVAERENRIKLPKLTIRPFDGDITQWTTFWDSYASAIHANTSLTDVDKFNYLRSLLRGPAREAVSGLTLTGANYGDAIAVLKRRFGNKQQIISRHMDTLVTIPAVTGNNDVRALRRLYDVVESNVRSLKSLGVPAESYGSLLSTVVMNKLPTELRLIIGRKIGDDDWKLDVILEELLKEVETRERIANANNPSSTQRRPQKEQCTAAALLSGDGQPHCCFCNQQHRSENCQVKKTAEERKQILKRNGRCFICLRRGHISRECRSRVRCSGCGGKHHLAVCYKSSTAESASTNSTQSAGNVSSEPTPREAALNPGASPFQPNTSVNTTMLVDGRGAVLLQTAKMSVYNPINSERLLTVRAIFDTGSQRSYVTRRIQDVLGLTPSSKQSMSIVTFGSGTPDVQTYDLVRVGVATKVGANQQLELIAVPVICQPLTSQSIDLCVSRYQHLRDLDLADSPYDGAALEVDVLIGSDYYWEFTTGDIRRGDDGPVAIRTTLGWVLSGTVSTSTDQVSPVNFLITHALSVGAPTNTENLDEVLRSFWNLESLGVKSVEETVLDEFSQMIRFKDGRYQVALPWKDPHPPLPDNYELSSKRLTGLLRRLKQLQEVLCEYDAIIRNQLQQGIVEEVNEPDNRVSGTIHYLPHHAVVRTDKETTKVRIVYDASAKSTGCSLNECLHVGPKFEQRILDILLRFRTYPVALAADIEKAFLMVSISEEDRNALRFLWVDDVASDPPKIRVLRFTRVVFGVSSSPFLLNATLQHHLNLYSNTHPKLVEQLSKSTYVDDVICGARDTESAYQLYRESKAVLKEGGFNLRKFVTNVTQLQQRIDDEERVPDPSNRSTSVHSSDDTYTKETLGTVQAVHSGEHKILGVRWNTSTDRLCFSFEDIARLASELEPTKRQLVSIVGRFYDPIGFLSPVVIKFKMLFQALCEERQDWDQLLTGDLLQRWKTLISELRSSPAMSMPRCLLDSVPGEVNSFSLHGFCDASKHAYAAVVYLVIETPNGRFTRFVASKTRVSPLKSQTIPRLELLSALLLARLMCSVTECLESELTLSKPICHTDSKVALYWIIGITKTWKQFVQHRVSEIRKLLPIDCWSHCSGVENPADLPSRGLNPVQLSLSNLWTNGPMMLGEPARDDEVERMPMPAECAVEMRAKDRDATLNLLNSDGPSLGQVIRCGDYSSLQRLLNVTSNVLKFIDNLKKKIRNDATTDGVSVSRAPDAELLWIKEAQRSLTASVQFRTLEKQFNLFLDDEGIWRCGGRLSNADVPYNIKHPILLPRDHHFTLLIVRRAHERVLHNGVKDTLNEVRSKFWIIKCRSLLKKLIHRCIVCKRFEGKPCLGPPPPPLPKFRVAEDPPFMYTGVDFAGPLFIRTGNLAADSKVWICLYTCCVVRAIHLDIVPDLTTSAFIRSLKRFSARRGLPKRIVSDNGKTFKAAARTINAIMQHEDVKQYLSGRGVEWVFNIERAPWWGGFFERMVRMTKRCLKKMIGRAKLMYDELVTVATEVEAVINSRPLSYISSDDMDEPLTPAHLLAGRRLLSLPDCRVNEDDFEVSAEHLTKRMNFLSRIVENFWKRWEREYLLELRDTHRYGERTSDTSPLSVGDIVLVHDDNQPRGFWRLACVKSLIEGNDGHTRGAILTVISPGEKRITLKRPLQRLYPLEVKTVSCNRSENEDESNVPLETPRVHETPSQEQTVDRQRRAAAINAREQCKAIALYEQENEILD